MAVDEIVASVANPFRRNRRELRSVGCDGNTTRRMHKVEMSRVKEKGDVCAAVSAKDIATFATMLKVAVLSQLGNTYTDI